MSDGPSVGLKDHRAELGGSGFDSRLERFEISAIAKVDDDELFHPATRRTQHVERHDRPDPYRGPI